LQWIRNDARDYKVYVANRLGEIDELTKIKEWRYVPTKLNVADIATRENYKFPALQDEWLYGPTFLRHEANEWPHDFISDRKETLPECITLIKVEVQEINLPVPDATRFSSWLRLLRSTSLVLKFINKCKKLTFEFDDTMEKAEILLLKKSQAESFKKELTEIKNSGCVSKTSNILTLSPYLDEYGVIRVGGRIGAATGILPESKNPIILDGRSYIARLIVKYYHYYYAHGNQETIVNEVKQRYWITRLRPTVKHITSKCSFCRIRKSKPEVQRMGDLPSARMAHQQRPFTYCGVDLFGPMEVTVGRRREKRYGVLFTCLTVRAIHLELVNNLTADSFIMALRRMAAKRGWPQYMYSDNGTNLRGANTELKKSIKNLDEDVLKDKASNHEIK
ncbi:uncharacterized protein LOC114252345, partial [Bombyx mandarina]|uniref:Uncharacterized protein LOC114252345 n=1 Tax=Bombyx mandarina TaxID=7092 RepID=A0A6J2KJX6_BOMMA